MYSCKAPCSRWWVWPTCLICKGQAVWVYFAAIFGMTHTHGARHAVEFVWNSVMGGTGGLQAQMQKMHYNKKARMHTTHTHTHAHHKQS